MTLPSSKYKKEARDYRGMKKEKKESGAKIDIVQCTRKTQYITW